MNSTSNGLSAESMMSSIFSLAKSSLPRRGSLWHAQWYFTQWCAL